jgi:tRNA (guanine9-N1)-methyltransferase
METTRSPSPASDAGNDAAPKSKRAVKREQKRQKVLQKRVAEKAAKKEAKRAKRESSQAAWEALTEEERARIKQDAAVARQDRIAASKAAAAARASADQAGKPICVVDLAFDEYMNEREISSLAQQLSYCHSANKNRAYPVRLAFTSVSRQLEAKMTTGYEKWAVQRDARHYLETFSREHVTYLSSESDETLDTLEPDQVYVVGGLVDHNRHKGLTHRLALEAGVRTARLPIDEHLQMSQRRVLAVNHVVDILVQRTAGADWPSALMGAMPDRRKALQRDDAALGADDAQQRTLDDVAMLASSSSGSDPASTAPTPVT